MRKMLTGMAILSTLLVSGVSRAADGVVSMTWDTCTGPVAKDISTPAIASILISVLGIDVPHKAYDVRVIYGDATQNVPDAWRFDASGCEGSSLVSQDVSGKACATFQGLNSLQIKKVIFSPPSDPYAPTLMQVLLANSYNDGVLTVNPATRYFLEKINFDLSAAVTGAGDPPNTCGGFETPMCFKLSNATYLDMVGTEIPFGRATPTVSVTAYNGTPADVCANVPAKAATWGQIKSQYH